MTAQTKATYTPGPWRRRGSIIDGSDPDSVSERWVPVASVERIGGAGYADEQEANAHLIAAAPALLEALRATQDAMEWLARSIPSDALTDAIGALDAAERAEVQACAAIRLAEGEP